ncbi:MAG: toxin-antitoxin system, antitoxin component [Candidatus Neomarinimicrobiota bacterium]|nr:MAG: toxin-antitoxin system, antitoxin component [Candidatus Neomarinimicrobiota bacterium]
MPQISLYIDEDTLEKIGQIAKAENISISKWVGNNIKSLIKNQYPKNFFSLFGAIKDETFQRSEELDPNLDTARDDF